MNLKLVFDSILNFTHREICQDYWSYQFDGNYKGYIEHIDSICFKYKINCIELFGILCKCEVYLNDVRCAYCGSASKVTVPADIPYLYQQKNWYCNLCACFSGG